MYTLKKNVLLGILLVLAACESKKTEETRTVPVDPLFQTMHPDSTQIQFANRILERPDFNIYTYRNFYNGGGVAIGDVNNDGLADIFFTSNFEENKLYLNKGNWKFEDITQKAGITGKKFWSTGVTFADVNADGFLDIYVCNSGSKDARGNQLYINNGVAKGDVPTFTEKAEAYGLADGGFSTHAAFFDYDRDGDLDMYLLNNSFTPIDRLVTQNIRTVRDKLGGDKLFRNDGEHFTDVSEQAGIYGSLIGFGLGITIGDVNNDNWLDIYISNDFYERDYLYINNRNGTFTESLVQQMPHISLSSMGADVADINNDGNLDIFVTDMLPGDDKRLKTTTTFEDYNRQQLVLSRDFHYQFARNMLHLNNNNGTFSEVGQLAGVAATDWSWGALLFDMDNDGQKDIFVANGIAKDLTNQDFLNFFSGELEKMQAMNRQTLSSEDLIKATPSTPIPNYAFRNKGGLQFENKAFAWGLGQPGFSNGAAYGDLDNDGDLDLVVNNEDTVASVYRNRSVEKNKTHFLRVTLKGSTKNGNGIGAKVYLYQKGNTQYLQQMPNRGFQSSVGLTMVFGLGTNPAIDSLRIVWPDDKQQTLNQVVADRDLTLEYAQAKAVKIDVPSLPKPMFADVTTQSKLAYTHRESNFVDYNRDGLLKQMYSTQGPALAVGDANGDGLDDVYVGGASGQAKKLFFQQKNGTFAEAKEPVLVTDSLYEDVDAVFFDAEGDKDLDLYVVTGSNEFESGSEALLDRLYLNDGKGHFTRDTQLPNLSENGSCVAATDFDKDGDTDLFVGGRMVSGKYGYDAPSFLYVNDGSGQFKNYTKRYLPASELGMVTDAVWQDLNGDLYPELIVVGDWMPVKIFENQQGKKLVARPGQEIGASSGWWNCIKPADVDGDGDMDFVVGNLGLNSRIKASDAHPAELYTSDFDKNGTVEQIISCVSEDGNSYPMVLKGDLQKQMPSIKKKFVEYSAYAGKTIADIFDADQLKAATVRQVTTAQSSILLNQGNFRFTVQALPLEAQFAPVCGIETLDYNHDGTLDLVLAGNFFDVLPEIGNYDASYGLVLKGTGKGNFVSVPARESGFFSRGQVRKLHLLSAANGQMYLILAKNNAPVQVVKAF